jgi:hypothetical protein
VALDILEEALTLAEKELPQETAPPVRFDVVSVYLVSGAKTEFQHFEGAFGWSEREDYEQR